MTDKQKKEYFCHQCQNCVWLDKNNPTTTDAPYSCARYKLELGPRSIIERMRCAGYKRRKTNKIPRKVY